MMKTTRLTKTLFNHHTPAHSINFYIPSATSSSGSVCDTTHSSLSSSYKSNLNTTDTQMNDDTTSNPPQESTLVLLTLIDKLKRELATVKQAKSQLETLYKAKSKSDLDKSAKITKLRLQYEYELNTFCKEDQKDLVCYLQRQLLVRDQRIAEQSFDIEQSRSWSTINGSNDNNANLKKKTKSIQILRSSDPDLVLSTNQHLYPDQKQTSQKEANDLHERVKRFERKFEVVKQDQPKDHTKELIKRALAKQASKDAVEYQKLLTRKNEEIEGLNHQIKQLLDSTLLESALRQANIEKLHLERHLLTSASTPSSKSTTNAAVSLQASH